jgi:hypothetical protein
MNSPTRDKNTLKDHNRRMTYDHIKMLSTVSKMYDATRNLIHRLRQNETRVHNRYEVYEIEGCCNCIFVVDKLLIFY